MTTALAVVKESDTLTKLDKARQMLAESRTLPEIKKIRDIAEAARAYTKAAHIGREAQNYAAEITLLASREAGKILGRLERKPGQRTDKPAASVAGGSEYGKALRENNIPERTAERWQQLAAIPQPTFENYISDSREKQKDITAAALLKLAPPKNESRPAPKPSEVRSLREWIKTECPGLDAIVQAHIKYGTDSPNVDGEFRDITVNEMKSLCKYLCDVLRAAKDCVA